MIVNYDRFATSKFLESIPPKSLLELLEPYRLYMKSVECDIVRRDGRIDYQGISDVLNGPRDRRFPYELIPALYLISEFASKPQMRTVMQELSDEERKEIPRNPAALGIYLYLHKPDLMEQVYLRFWMYGRPKYSYFRLPRQRADLSALPEDFHERLMPLLKQIHNKPNATIMLSQFDYFNKQCVIVRLGDKRSRYDYGHRQTQSILAYKPHSVIMFDRDEKEVLVSVPRPMDGNLFAGAVCRLLGGGQPWANDIFTVDPILSEGKDSISAKGVPELLWVKLKMADFESTEGTSGWSRLKSKDLNHVVGADDMQREGEALTSLTFQLKVRGHSPSTVTITPPNFAAFPHSDIMPVIEKWLRLRGYKPAGGTGAIDLGTNTLEAASSER